MDFRVVIMVFILPVATPVPGGIRERDTSQRATCTAPVATKGKTAVVTCHYPLDVKQPGEMVAVSVERYPLPSSSTDSDHILDCMWHEDFTCTLDEEEHTVGGKDVVITIKNVNEDSQGRYVCQMMVKDGPNIHGDACRLLVMDTNPSDPLPSTTDPALDQPTTRDNDKATCTAPVATKGETAEVTCHYPLDVKQPGEIVSVSVERYPLTPSSTGLPDSDHILDCQWDGDFTCTLDEEEHRVEGKDVVITIRNVNEDSQGRYLCQMMVKDGPNIHGETCWLLVMETSSGGNTAAGTITGIVVGCVVLLAIVAAVVMVIVCKRSSSLNKGMKKTPTCSRQQEEERAADHTVKESVLFIPAAGSVFLSARGNGPPAEEEPLLRRGENQLPYQDPERPGAPDERNSGDDNHGNGPLAERDRLLEGEEPQTQPHYPARPGAPDERNSDDVNHGDGHPERDQNHSLEAENPEEQAPGDNDNDRGNGPLAERDRLLEGEEPQTEPHYPARPGAQDERNSGDVNHDDRPEGWVRDEVKRIEEKDARSTSDMSDDRPEGRVRREVKHIENMRSRSTSDMRPSNEMEETENAYGEKKEDDANETGERQDRKQEMRRM